MKLLFYLFTFFLVFTVSHAFHFVINPENHDDHDHLIKSSSNGGDSLIRLPVETENNNDNNNNKQPQLETTSFGNHVIDVEQYLTELMNRRPVLLPNRFRFPRRCRNHHRLRRFGPGIEVGPRDDVASIFKKRAEVIGHRHVAAGRFGGEGEGEFLIIPVKHFHRIHHHVHHHGEVDPTVEMKREKEYEVKEEYDNHHHHHDHDHDDDEVEENGIVKKILKYLPHF